MLNLTKTPNLIGMHRTTTQVMATQMTLTTITKPTTYLKVTAQAMDSQTF